MSKILTRTRCPFCGQRITFKDEEDGDSVVVRHIDLSCTLKPVDWRKPAWARADFK